MGACIIATVLVVLRASGKAPQLKESDMRTRSDGDTDGDDGKIKKQRTHGKLYILMDNTTWFAPLRTALENEGVPFEEWILVERTIDFMGAPPEGVFLNKVSASCHTRGHREAAEYGRQVVLWLLAHGRRVINGGVPPGAAIDFELSKLKQGSALKLAGIPTPECVGVPVAILVWKGGKCDYAYPPSEPRRSPEEALRASLLRLASAAEGFSGPVVLKPNCGGRGVGVKKFDDAKTCVQILRRVAEGSEVAPAWLVDGWPIDGVYVVQRNIIPAEACVTRVELIGGVFGYAQRTDTSDGAVNLCTADGCRIAGPSRFSMNQNITAKSPITELCVEFAAKHGLDVAGFEFIEEAGSGTKYVYDINPNTNYSTDVIRMAGRDLNKLVAELCKSELERGSSSV